MIEDVNDFPVLVALRLRGPSAGRHTDEYIVVCDRGVREPDRFVTWSYRPSNGAFWGFYTDSYEAALENAIRRYGFGLAELNPEAAPSIDAPPPLVAA